MKKIFYILSIAAVALFASCAKEEIGGTACQDMAGQWYVQVDGIDEKGEVVEEDPFGAGRFILLTSNTAANKADEILVDDQGNFWKFCVKVAADPAKMTFSASKGKDLYNDIDVDIDGKIVLGGTETPSGQKADYFEMDVVFSDDEYVGTYWSKLRFSGWRYTGFENDD